MLFMQDFVLELSVSMRLPDLLFDNYVARRRLPKEIFIKILSYVYIFDFKNLMKSFIFGHTRVENEYKNWLQEYVESNSIFLICPMCYEQGLCGQIFDQFLFQAWAPRKYRMHFLFDEKTKSVRFRISGYDTPQFVERYEKLLNNPGYTLELIHNILTVSDLAVYQTLIGFSAHLESHQIQYENTSLMLDLYPPRATYYAARGTPHFTIPFTRNLHTKQTNHTFLLKVLVRKNLENKEFKTARKNLHKILAFKDYLQAFHIAPRININFPSSEGPDLIDRNKALLAVIQQLI